MRYKIVITLLLLSIFTSLFFHHLLRQQDSSDKNIMLSEIINFMKSFSAAYKRGCGRIYDILFFTAFENGNIPVDKIKADYMDVVSHNIVTLYN